MKDKRPLARVALALRAIALVGFSVTCGAADPGIRARSFATLPDWTGIWETEAAAALLAGKPPGGPPPKLWGKPPYTAAAQAKYAPDGFPLAGAATLFEAFGILAHIQGTAKGCGPMGFPASMEAPVPDYLFELLVTPEQTLFVGTDGTLRHIYTDGRPHPNPEDLWPTATGDSVGHWEGTTLVIDTIAREAGPILRLAGLADLSDRAHFTERLRRIDADTLEDAMTIEDPQRLAHSWQLTIRYLRVKDVNRMIAVNCEQDRDTVVDGEIVVSPPR